MLTNFWDDVWFRTTPLELLSLDFFLFLNRKKGKVGEIDWWVGESLVWDLQWRKSLFDYKRDLVDGLTLALQGITLSLECDR